jgi:hypothetical protein
VRLNGGGTLCRVLLGDFGPFQQLSRARFEDGGAMVLNVVLPFGGDRAPSLFALCGLFQGFYEL